MRRQQQQTAGPLQRPAVPVSLVTSESHAATLTLACSRDLSYHVVPDPSLVPAVVTKGRRELWTMAALLTVSCVYSQGSTGLPGAPGAEGQKVGPS